MAHGTFRKYCNDVIVEYCNDVIENRCNDIMHKDWDSKTVGYIVGQWDSKMWSHVHALPSYMNLKKLHRLPNSLATPPSQMHH